MTHDSLITRETDYRQADALISTCLRGEEAAWPERPTPRFSDTVLGCSDFHGVRALLYNHLAHARGWPAVVVNRLRDNSVASAMWESHHQRILSRLLGALAECGIEPVLFKGTALAYAYYEDPALRSRGDTDMIIASAQREEAQAILRILGFQQDAAVSGDLISYQACYWVRDPLGSVHAIDLHWKINNSELLSRLFTYAELRERAVKLSNLNPQALATCPADALLLACMHRQVHRQSPYWVDGVAYFSADRLIWLYDIRMLASTMRRGDWNLLVRLAREKGLSAVCQDGLRRAGQLFYPACPTRVLDALDPGRRAEPPYTYLHASALQRGFLDFRSLEGTARKLRFLRELLFPPAAYMRSQYADVRPDWLPWLYARRAFNGLAKRLRVGRAL